MRGWIRAFAAFAFLAPAAAHAWTGCPTSSLSTTNTDQASMSKTSNRVLCHDTAVATASDSGILNTGQCDHLEIQFKPDITGTTTGAEAQIYRCTAPVATSSYCTKMLVDTDGDGLLNDVTLDGTTIGRIGMLWQTAQYLWVDVTVAPSGSAIARTIVSCY